jgi:hypothetical protein
MEMDSARGESVLQLDGLSRLEPGWDGYGAEPVAQGCVDNARMILGALPSNVPGPDITPNSNGTLSFDWENGQQGLSLEIGISRYSAFWESARRFESDEGDLADILPNIVSMALASMFPPSDWMPPLSEYMIEAHGQLGSLVARYCR